MNTIDAIVPAIEELLLFIKNEQHDDGLFESISIAENQPLHIYAHKTTFFSSLIACCLKDCSNFPVALEVLCKIEKFLVLQKSAHESFNYWARGSLEFKEIQYPDDLDDTFCGLAALTIIDSKNIEGAALARIVQLLRAAEQTPGGPYHTWLVQTNDAKWNDVDIAVNSNIQFFLSLHNIKLEKVTTFIDNAIKKHTLKSPYYPSPIPLLYFISRAYTGTLKQDLIQQIYALEVNHHWENALYTSLAVTSLLRLGEPLEKIAPYVTYILKHLEASTAWSPICVDPKRNGKIYFGGSASLTAASTIEALLMFWQIQNQLQPTSKQNHETQLHQDIIAASAKQIEHLPTVFGTAVLRFTQELLKKDARHEITLTHTKIFENLQIPITTIDRELLVQLGCASLLGWAAYRIYDDFLDNEGHSKLLPIANWSLKEFIQIMTPLVYRSTFNTIFEKLEAANYWETTMCWIKTSQKVTSATIPDYKNHHHLAAKSFGHTLGTFAILQQLGYTEQASIWKNVHAFFTHYLITRQLNDDAHDWAEDLRKGYINSVGSMVLKQYFLEHASTTIFIPKHMETLKNLFWQTNILPVTKLINQHCTDARKLLAQEPLFTNKSGGLAELLLPIESATRKALHEHEQVNAFFSTLQ